MISFKNVTKIYNPNTLALDNISFDIKEGEFVLIVGKSGAGKTTLMKLITKEEEPTQGEVVVNGLNLNIADENALNSLRRMTGTVFQDFRLINHKNVFENISYSMEVVGADDSEIKRDVPDVLEMVGLKEKFHSFPKQLSGGEKQRVAIARALIHRPKLILADEPTGNLDVYSIRDILDALLKVNQMGATIILATHNQSVVNFLQKRVITLENGKIIRDQEKGKFIL
ncbi:MAG TPA: cell division ATP-binding protein FtsE [Candidatus Pacearchaeota archaeon]|nr:cell division ATP-binding protein FtsE [Candidatus Parcubacteria bacterium]HOU46114.1 cell division ATP-binding protein FtsE [Candidatus Pacearchaeota archaeon]HPM08655.1 cell division ATP-binding protein FtsE [Candidatus Pacearchaeota archaeon]HQI74674.1 cell division ATP-binding protein FtsE [Candidatus Pacearchaeota archaeon]